MFSKEKQKYYTTLFDEEEKKWIIRSEILFTIGYFCMICLGWISLIICVENNGIYTTSILHSRRDREAKFKSKINKRKQYRRLKIPSFIMVVIIVCVSILK